MATRCVCGRSETFPLCDGRHEAEGWQCEGPRAGTVVWGGRHLASAARRLAHHLGAELASERGGRVARLLVLADAADLPELSAGVAGYEADTVEVLAVDVSAAAVRARLPEAVVRSVSPPDPLQLWRALRAALEREEPPLTHLASAFLSHAVADEEQLIPVVDHARRYAGAEVFLCADSIGGGERWLERILEALEGAQRFVLVVSAASAASAFCGFEAGWARRAGKPLRILSLDGTPPPAFVGEVQAFDVVRYRSARPWLTEAEALTEGLLDCLS